MRLSDLWDEKDAERGIALGLIVGTILAAVFTTSDYLALNFDYVRGQNPYGVLWYALNPQFWTDVPYRIWVTGFLFVSEAFMYFGFVRNGRLSKFLFYAGWLQSLIWMRGTVYQNVTVTALAPLGSIFPWLIIPLMLLQKLPIGWSFPNITANAHWWCAFTGNTVFTNGDTITFPNGQKLISCPGGALRWNIQYAWFWSYAMILFWVLYPLIYYLVKSGKLGKFSRRYLHYPGYLQTFAQATGTDWTIQDSAACHMNYPNNEWFCSLCGEWMKVDWTHQNGIWFNGEWLCWICCLTPDDVVQEKLFESGLCE